MGWVKSGWVKPGWVGDPGATVSTGLGAGYSARSINIAAHTPQQMQVALRELLAQIAALQVQVGQGVLVAQSGHGMATGDVVYVSSTGAFGKAIATSEGTCAVAVVTSVVDTNHFYVTFSPQVLAWSHGYPLNVPLYLSQTAAGEWVETRPDDGWIQEIGRGLTAGVALWQRERPEFT